MVYTPSADGVQVTVAVPLLAEAVLVVATPVVVLVIWKVTVPVGVVLLAAIRTLSVTGSPDTDSVAVPGTLTVVVMTMPGITILVILLSSPMTPYSP